MKLQIAFNNPDLDLALRIAAEVQEHADIIEVGSLLVYKYGNEAIRRFKEKFPHKQILADLKIVDSAKEAVAICAQAGADWITVMAGTGKNVIHTACTAAHEQGKRIMLDLGDASSLGQSALEAKSLGVDALLFSKSVDTEEQLTFLDRWDMVKGNTQLPVFISATITRENIQNFTILEPAALVLSNSITQAENPAQEAAFFHALLNNR